MPNDCAAKSTSSFPRISARGSRNSAQLRREVLATHPRGEERRLLLHELAQRHICDSALCSTRQLARTGREAARAVAGHVHLVGAGPGDPELLTVKAVRIIESADVILHDDLVAPAILNLAPLHAMVENVGKRCGTKTITQDEINALMIEHARAGRSVVRLKSGDPLLVWPRRRRDGCARRSRRAV